MGVPKFFRWLAERYPLVLEKVSTEPVEIDNLYLDMNGIIHNCTHANNAAKATASEEEMIHLSFQYIERLVRIAKPKKLLYMAIDGVAPRAKMNQQRSRRFKAGKEREEAEQRARRLGEDLPTTGLFDSNCITPGTDFMHRLDRHLKFFVRRKLATDPSWAKIKVLYSGYDVPGEGEHKIMEFIRYEKVRVPQPAPNTRHCMYGLDADLILLSLATHEPHFCLLRESVAFNNNQRGQPSREVLEMKKDDFQLLHIGILREYLREETYLPGAVDTYNLERVIDDFVLLCVLVGNDFLPHSPTLDITEGAMDVIFETYRNSLVRIGHHLTQGERISHVQLELFLATLAEKEVETLVKRAEDQIDFENRRSRQRGAPERGLMPEADDGLEESQGAAEKLFSTEPTMMGAQARDMLLSGDTAAGLASYKSRMYMKMDADSDYKVRSVVEWYMEGLHWVMQYYYRGVPSWNWYYPFHYAPFLSDMKDLQSIMCEFTQSEPVKPFQQLMMVMPTSSKALLPQPFHSLMDDPNSPIADFYPLDFAVDGEGKRTEWEAVVLLPFIDFKRLVEAYNTKAKLLSPEAVSRNTTGKMYLFRYQKGSTETSFCQSTLPTMLPSITNSNSTVAELTPKKPLPPGTPGFQPVLIKGCMAGPSAPKIGWPSLQIVPFSTTMQSVGVNLLGIVSKRATRVLAPDKEHVWWTGGQGGGSLHPQSATLLNKVCFFRYPHLMRCKVVELTDGKSLWTAAEGKSIAQLALNDAQKERHCSAISEAKSKLLLEQGIDASGCDYFFRVLRNVGVLRLRDGSITVKFEDHGDYVPMPLLLETSAGESAAVYGKVIKTAAFVAGSVLVFRGLAHYGALATVMQHSTEGDRVVYRIQLKARSINFKACSSRMRSAMSRAEQSEKWFPSFVVARRLGIESSVLGRLTGNCRVTVGDKSFDIGLSLRHGTDLCVPELAHPATEGKGWQYSSAAAQLMAEFQQKFPWVANLCMQSNSATLLLSDAFPGLDTEAQISKAKAVQSWRAQSIVSRMKLVPVSSIVASAAAVREIDATFSAVCCSPVRQLELMHVGAELLVPPLAPGTTSEVTASSADVGDCIVFVGADDGTSPPFGSLGVAIAVHDGFVDVLCAEKFAAGTDLEGRVRKGYGARLSFDVVVNLTDMSGAEMSCPEATPLSKASNPMHQALNAAPSTPTAPMIPDGTRGFHQQNGYGRGKPVGAEGKTPVSAGITITPQALLQNVGAVPAAQPPAATAVQDAGLPDFMLNLLRAEPQASNPAAAAPAPAPVPSAPSAPTPLVDNAVKSGGPAARQAADDMVMRLLHGGGGGDPSADPTAKAAAPATASPQPASVPTPIQPAAEPLQGAGPERQQADLVRDHREAAERSKASDLSAVQFVDTPSTSSFSGMTSIHQQAVIRRCMLQTLRIAQDIFNKAGKEAMHSSAGSLVKDVDRRPITRKWVEEGRDCARHAASLLESTAEAVAYCQQSESILLQATQALADEEVIGASTDVSEAVVQLRSMDNRITAGLQWAEHWCYLAASTKSGPEWEDSEAVMKLCLSIQRARAGVSPITSTLIDQLCQYIDKVTVGSDLYVSSQHSRVRLAALDAARLRKRLVQKIPDLVGDAASRLLAGCNASCSKVQTSASERQRAQQLLATACVEQSLPKEAMLACLAWVSQIQAQDRTNSKMLTDLLSCAQLLSSTAERYGLQAASAAVPQASAAGHVKGGVRSSAQTPPASWAANHPVATTPNVTSMSVAVPAGALPQPALPSQAASAGAHLAQQGGAVSVHETHGVSPAPMQQGAPNDGVDLVASLLQAGGGTQRAVSGPSVDVAKIIPAISHATAAPGSIVGIPVVQGSTISGSDVLNELQQQRTAAQVQPVGKHSPVDSSSTSTVPGSIVGIPVAASSTVAASDPMIAMWKDLQG